MSYQGQKLSKTSLWCRGSRKIAIQNDWGADVSVQGSLEDLFIWMLVEPSRVWREAREVCSEHTLLSPEPGQTTTESPPICLIPVTFFFSLFFPSLPFPPAARCVGQISPCASPGSAEEAHSSPAFLCMNHFQGGRGRALAVLSVCLQRWSSWNEKARKEPQKGLHVSRWHAHSSDSDLQSASG